VRAGIYDPEENRHDTCLGDVPMMRPERRARQALVPLVMEGPAVIWQSYPEGLDSFLLRHHAEPDDTIVVFQAMPYGPKPDGSYGPPSTTVGRLREEYLLRGAFPHGAATVVF
jgi:hypothetical protein